MDPALLDTDILSELLKQKNINVRNRALAYLQQHGSLTFSSMTRYEIVRGYRSVSAARPLARFLAFCQQAVVVPVTDAVFDRAAELWVAARRGGYPSADADLIIGATALEESRVLVTGNSQHFAWMAGLRLEDWRQP